MAGISYVEYRKTAKMTFDEFGMVHSENDEPSQVLPNGTKRWSYHGVLHRDDNKPASYHVKGTTTTITYATFGQITKVEDVKTSDHNNKRREVFYENGYTVRHKKYNNGILIRDDRFFNGSYGDAKGILGYNTFYGAKPTSITYYVTGELESEAWFFNNKLCRYDGPAKISYNIDGTIKKETWAILNRQSSLSEESIQSLLKLKALGI